MIVDSNPGSGPLAALRDGLATLREEILLAVDLPAGADLDWLMAQERGKAPRSCPRGARSCSHVRALPYRCATCH